MKIHKTKKYDVVADFWRRGNLVKAGETVWMDEFEAKYLGHVLAVPAPVVMPQPEHAPSPEPAAEPAPEPEQPHRRRRKAERTDGEH